MDEFDFRRAVLSALGFTGGGISNERSFRKSVVDGIAAFAARTNPTGWASYNDGTYTEGSPLELAADTDTVLPNDAASKIETYMPSDYTTMMVGGKVQGKQGDSLIITVDFTAKPTNVGSTYLETWFDIGGSVGELYRRPITFPKGNGVERQVVLSTAVYTLDTWEANGATLYIRGNNTFDIYDIRVIVTRVSKGAS